MQMKINDLESKITPKINIYKNMAFLAGVIISFSLWLSSVVKMPARIDILEQRTLHMESNEKMLQLQLSLISEDIKEIKKILMQGGR
ncbi:hypothetical protein Dip518_000013 [Parelusimicrobium proximum]|uniref:hypothetical protein n=1 Tax=Parelusimicrobium proximum TaxID=3228953 RepID=UPI003D1872DF